MILMYHKVDLISPTKWWVSVATFAHQMDALATRDVVYLADYDPHCDRQCVITFDDAYENIHRHALPILKERRLRFEVFINGDLLGCWNHADRVEPSTRYCGIDQLDELAAHGARIQWHGRSHANLTALDPQVVDNEIGVPEELRLRFPTPHFTWFAYPFGAHSPTVVDAVRKKFTGAVSVADGNAHDPYLLNRVVMSDNRVAGNEQERAKPFPALQRCLKNVVKRLDVYRARS